MLLSVALSWPPNPDAIFQYLNSESKFGKAVGIKDEVLDQIMTDAHAEMDTAKRAAKNLEFQKLVADQAYILQIYQYPLHWGMPS